MSVANSSAELLGAALGNLVGNPATLIAGLIVSRLPSRLPRFWVELLIAIGFCVGAQILIEDMLDRLPSGRSSAQWVAITTLSVVFATLIFKGLRRVKGAMPLHEQRTNDAQD